MPYWKRDSPFWKKYNLLIKKTRKHEHFQRFTSPPWGTQLPGGWKR